MKKRKALPLKWLIPIFVFVGIGLSGVGVNTLLNEGTEALIYSKTQDQLNTVANTFRSSLKEIRYNFEDVETQKRVQRILENASGIPAMNVAVIVSSDLKVLSDGQRLMNGQALPEPLRPFIEIAAKDHLPLEALATYQGAHVMVLVRSIEGGAYDPVSRMSDVIYLLMVYELTMEDLQLGAHLRMMVLIQFAAVGLLALLIYIILRLRITRPLLNLEATVEALGRLEFTARAVTFHHDELGRTANAVNSMAKKVGEATVSKRYVETVLNSMFDMLLVVDSSRIIRTVNRTTLEQLGYQEEELLGRKVLEVLEPAADGHPYAYETRILSRSGEWICVEVSRSRTELNGDDECQVYIIRDVTERNRAQAELEKARQTNISTSRLSALGEMAGGIAHEINNPLAIILGRATQLKRLAQEGNVAAEEINQFTDKIEVTAKRIEKIVKGLRAISRHSDSDPFVRTNVISVVEEVTELCREKFKHNQVKLEVAAETRELSAECRPAEIGQVLINLLHNAFDAVLNLEERWIRVEVSENNSFVLMQVTDSGTGIPEAVLRKLMQPFFTTKEVGKGTGLGLSISRNIALSHGGELRYDTASSHTRFVLSLPKRQEQREST